VPARHALPKDKELQLAKTLSEAPNFKKQIPNRIKITKLKSFEFAILEFVICLVLVIWDL
jgi:hypothetical protein